MKTQPKDWGNLLRSEERAKKRGTESSCESGASNKNSGKKERE